MEIGIYIRFFLALCFTLSLIGIVYWLAKRFGLNRITGKVNAGDRIGILEIRQIDSRHKLVLIRCDTTEHLILISPEGGVLLENIGEYKRRKTTFDDHLMRND